MALRALLFSKNPESNAVLTTVCQSAGVRAEVCDDIFTAIEKGTKQSFGIILVDWSSQPEAGFLIKRARESGPNRQFAAIAIVDRDPSAAEMREQRLDFLIHRPVTDAEVQDILASAMQKTPGAAVEDGGGLEANRRATEAGGVQSATSPEANAGEGQQGDGKFSFEWSEDRPNVGESATEAAKAPSRDNGAFFRKAFTAAVVMTALFVFWSGRGLLIGFAKSPEGKVRVLRESVGAFFHLEAPESIPVIAAKPLAPRDASAAPPPDNSMAPAPHLQVVEGELAIDDSHVQLRKAADFPLPMPQLDASAAAPFDARKVTIPDSIRGSAPIAPPVVVTVNPAQMMPVSSPSIPAPSSQTFTEPVPVSEETERSLLLRSIKPDYPVEAVPQKLHGSVVLQATIGRDGSVEDLKIVRGYFVLGKAAIAAVKQWQFKPYTFNGHAARTQTVLTVNFPPPAN
ncbi:MAG: TonB family protein [Terriglobales bacterium]